MTIHNLITELAPFRPTALLADECAMVNSVRLLQRAGQPGGAAELCLAHPEELMTLGVPACTANLLIMGEPQDLDGVLTAPEELNRIFLPAGTSLPELLNFLLELFAQEQRASCGIQALSDSITPQLPGMELRQILDRIYELLGNPFSICNTDGVLIDYKAIDRVPGPEGMVFLRGGYVPSPETFHEVCQQVNLSPEPVLFSQFAGMPVRNVVAKITVGNEPVAYFLMLEHQKTILPGDLALLKVACQWLGIEMQQSKAFLTPASSLIAHLLADLLDDAELSRSALEQRCEMLKYGKREWNNLLLADCSDAGLNQYQIQGLRHTLELLLPGSHSVLYQGYIVIHVNTATYDFFTPALRARLAETAEAYHLRLGLSYRYHDLLETRFAFEQASAAIQFGSHIHPDKVLYLYDDYALYHLLDQVRSTSDLRRFCHPKLLELIEYDRKNDTLYTLTLYVLILSGGRQAEAAKRLHIHRSTLLYRIEKIMEITGDLDLHDIGTGTRLFLSYSILVYTGDLDAKEYPVPKRMDKDI